MTTSKGGKKLGRIATQTTERRCFKCKQIKKMESFYRNRAKGGVGRSSICINCKNIYDRKRYSENREHILEVNRKYNQSEAGKARSIRTSHRMYKKYPHKQKARAIFNHAVKIGNIKKQPCVVCMKEKADGHHPDYSKPLEVIWLCRTHHKELHMKGKIQL